MFTVKFNFLVTLFSLVVASSLLKNRYFIKEEIVLGIGNKEYQKNEMNKKLEGKIKNKYKRRS